MMQSESINNDLNYKVNNGVGNPKYIQADSSFQYLELFFETKFLLGVDYQLSIDSSILDCSGHSILGNLQFPFVLPKNAEYGDVLINEIMAQPSPSNGLPNTEYLELYNQSEYPISLYHWTLKFGKSSFVFPKMLLEGRSFLLLSNNDDITLFNTSISTLGVSSLSLANGGSNLVLKNDQNQIIHFIKYSDSWYSEDYKAEGGWSLEMISPDYFCDQESNWSASENSKGGTPGEANSIAHLAVEEKAPRIISLDLLNPNTIQIQFSKTMDSVALKNSNNYTVSPDLRLLIQPRIYQPAYDLAQLQFVQDISAATIYHLDIDPGLAGCNGLEIENFSLPFSLPEEPEPGDIIINEVLFDSWPNDGDYVELYNYSNKVIDSRQLLFSHIPLDPFDSLYSSFPLKAGQIFPHTYLLLCKNKSAISSIYYSPENSNYCLTDEFPRLPNSEGEIGISKISSSSSFIDRFHYNVKMHHSLINNKKGVSLERISFQEETNNTNNWTSAASIVNFGTPGYQNSQHLEPGNSLDEISVSPEIFSPDLDGRDDLLQIDCHFKEPENTLNLIIFNAQGKRVRHLVKNDIMGLNAQYYWDGTWDDGNRAEYGIYILYFEYFNLMGEVKKVKKICVLGGVL